MRPAGCVETALPEGGRLTLGAEWQKAGSVLGRVCIPNAQHGEQILAEIRIRQGKAEREAAGQGC